MAALFSTVLMVAKDEAFDDTAACAWTEVGGRCRCMTCSFACVLLTIASLEMDNLRSKKWLHRWWGMLSKQAYQSGDLAGKASGAKGAPSWVWEVTEGLDYQLRQQ